MYTFKKGSDIAQIDNNKVQLHISINIKETEGVYLIDIPSLNISSYTVKEENIDDRIDESLESFFKYWLKIEGEEKFIEYMFSLGFALYDPKASPEKSIDLKKKKQLFETLLRMGYSVSSSATTESNESINSDSIKGEETKRTLDEELVIA